MRGEARLGAELSERFEARLKIRKDPEVTVFLRQIAEKLSAQAADLRLAPVGVLLIQEGKGASKAPSRNFGLPGNRVYLSVSALKRMDYENEVAAAIAIELAHISRRHALENMIKMTSPAQRSGAELTELDRAHLAEAAAEVDFTGPAGILTFGDSQTLEAIELAVELLYRAGYDPRGIVSFYNHRFGKSAPAAYIEASQRALAKYSPLLNPVVRSAGFLELRKRIQQL